MKTTQILGDIWISKFIELIGAQKIFNSKRSPRHAIKKLPKFKDK